MPAGTTFCNNSQSTQFSHQIKLLNERMTFNHRVTSLSLSAWPAVSVGGNKLQMMFQLLLLHVLLVLWFKGIRLNLRKKKKQKHRLKQRGSSLPPGKTYECWIMQQTGVLYNHVLLSTHTLLSFDKRSTFSTHTQCHWWRHISKTLN